MKLKGLFVLLAALFIITGCTQYSGGEPVEKKEDEKPKDEVKKEEPKKEETKKAEPKKELTLDDKVTKQINKKFGKETNTDKKRIIELTINDNLGTDKEGDKIILLTLTGDENLTTKMAIKGMLMKSKDAFQQVFKNKEAEEVTLFWQYPMIDAYGKSKDENVIKITLTKGTFDKIEWKTFDYKNFEAVADQFWMHQALQNELSK
ncbi:hypothetical protein [Peribacillus sp. NPDC096540]|uniref:hypothetical protein n=1 Tax=Peribacillus sp. NPDC096540 TaxID=3390612 RepID=UPI003CFEAEE2